MAIRLFFFLLVLVNLVFFAWTQGYFGAADDGHEPLRLAQQLHPEKLRIATVVPTRPAPRNEKVCRLVVGLSMADADGLKAAIEAGGGEARILPQAEPALYLVVIAELAGKAAAEKKAAELSRLGVKEFSTTALENGRHEIILGRFPDAVAAREFLQGLTKRGVKSGRVESREQLPVKARIEARAPESVLLQQLPQLVAPLADATIGECAS